MVKGYPDVPVAREEQDLFDTSIYIESLADFIKTCKTPMTIAIQGDWGSGKTSMMNMIRGRLGNKVVTVWFNTWQYSQFDMSANLPISLLAYLTDRIGDEKSGKDMTKALFKVLKGAALLASRVVVENIAGETAANALAASSDEAINYAKAIEELKQQFKKTVDARLCAESKDRVVIFVDDLDRLAPEVAVEVLEVLKLFVDVDNCVYVLAVDYEVVSQGIRKKFGDAVSKEKGRSFFDKIIQLPFRMPVGLYNLDKYVTNTLKDLGIVVIDGDLAMYKDLIVRSIGQNPRSMKRLFNSFQLIKTVASKKNGAQKMDAHAQRILFGILCMQMAYEDLYDYLLTNRGSFTQSDFFCIADADALWQKIDKDTPQEDRRFLSAMYGFYQVFLQTIQLDTDSELSQDEVKNLSEIFSFSAITSNTTQAVEQVEDNARYRCRGVAKALVELLEKKHNKPYPLPYSLYQGRKEPEASARLDTMFKGLYCCFDIKVGIKNGQYTVEVYIYNTQKTYRRDFERAGETAFAGMKYAFVPGDANSYFVFLAQTPMGIDVDSPLQYWQIAEKCHEMTAAVIDAVLEKVYG